MPNTDKTYNGWANYATWRVNLEVFGSYDPDGTFMTAESCEEWVTEMVDGALQPSILSGWVTAFLSDVDWQEIADGINEVYELTDPDADSEA